MYLLKLVLPLAGLLVAGQALAHKASRAMPPAAGYARPALAQAGAPPAALLGGVGGRSAKVASAMPVTSHRGASGKTHGYTRSH